MDTPVELLEKQIKVFISVKHSILAESESLLLRGQKTEDEIKTLIEKVEAKINDYSEAIKILNEAAVKNFV